MKLKIRDMIPLALAGGIIFLLSSCIPIPPPSSNLQYGVTIDDITNTSGVIDAAKNLPVKPWTRIVFDPGLAPSYYSGIVTKLAPYSFEMGQPVDSSEVKATSISSYHNRFSQYLAAMHLDEWEVGNEVNGEWLGTTADVVTKITDAYNQVHGAGQRAALTLYYNPNCWSKSSNEMFTWANANIPPSLKSGMDAVYISYYEGDCNNHRMTASETQSVFDHLHIIFPKAILGFGEIGLGNDATVNSSNLTLAQNIMSYYYSLTPTTPGYILGGFWWHWYEDALPWNTHPLWNTFASLEK